jgi:hypothetical protein
LSSWAADEVAQQLKAGTAAEAIQIDLGIKGGIRDTLAKGAHAAWEYIKSKPEYVKKGWEKCGLLKAVDPAFQDAAVLLQATQPGMLFKVDASAAAAAAAAAAPAAVESGEMPGVADDGPNGDEAQVPVSVDVNDYPAISTSSLLVQLGAQLGIAAEHAVESAQAVAGVVAATRMGVAAQQQGGHPVAAVAAQQIAAAVAQQAVATAANVVQQGVAAAANVVQQGVAAAANVAQQAAAAVAEGGLRRSTRARAGYAGFYLHLSSDGSAFDAPEVAWGPLLVPHRPRPPNRPPRRPHGHCMEPLLLCKVACRMLLKFQLKP